MNTSKRIFLVEDDQNFGSVLKAYLEINDYVVDWVNDGKFALKHFSEHDYDICVLDIMLPNLDGIIIAQHIKKLKPEMPFIFLTAKTLKEDIIKGYETGADDYLTKPFDSDVLLCKINAILNRSSNNQEELTEEHFQIGKYRYEYPIRTIFFEEKSVKLSPKEAELLKLLCQHKNNILSRALALESIWGEETYFTKRSMDVFITKLRKYLKDDPTLEIINIHGEGYRFIVPD